MLSIVLHMAAIAIFLEKLQISTRSNKNVIWWYATDKIPAAYFIKKKI